MTIVEGDQTLIVIDPLLTAETARAALDLYLPAPPTTTGRNGDLLARPCRSFRRRQGVVSEADVTAGKVKVLAPSGFMETAVAENILAGNAMSRRAQYSSDRCCRRDPAAKSIPASARPSQSARSR